MPPIMQIKHWQSGAGIFHSISYDTKDMKNFPTKKCATIKEDIYNLLLKFIDLTSSSASTIFRGPKLLL